MFSQGGEASKATDRGSRSWFNARALHCPKAFPGDTYVADLKKATKTGKVWTRFLFLMVLLSVLADFYLLQDAFAWMLGEASMADMMARGDSLMSMILSPSVYVCAVLVVLYLVFADIAGKKLAEFRAFRGRSSVFAFGLLVIVLLVVLGFIALVRFESIVDELGAAGVGQSMGSFGGGDAFGSGGNASASSAFGFGVSSQGAATGMLSDFWALDPGDQLDALTRTALITSVMMLGAFLEMLHSYYSFDPYAGEKLRLAEGCIAEDKRLYLSVYARYVMDVDKNAEYEAKEQELDKETVACAFRISELAAQLNGIVDPADAHDFCAVSRLLATERTGYGRESRI